ncbi:hypothetical protein HDF24_14610 [Mucilaginibacter sp. X4EP1]|uniref:hypothetical protein n=1 Tax=Mucilaginibacter sp. X4EP1 TaxID=2723092 RepID=UPI0021697EC4|nr:hypothetical protein [Mucilaginibacter sp. X4EP1]MCS3815476.1 hypothetical protein [Mucilaginibacter sp. X4EP1]
MESNKLRVIVCAVLLLLSALATKSNAQSFSDFFGQSKKQLQDMEKQIAALNAFETSVRQGYNMLHSEWTAIGSLKNGEFLQHQTYYSSLSQVNPVVKNSTNLTSIQSQQQSIISQLNGITNEQGLTANEQSYVAAVSQNIISQCNNDLDELQKVMTAGQLQMSDDERIKRIKQLTASIQDKYLFTCHFTSQVKLLALSRTQENDQLQTERGLYGIN